ncbi:hypothetical protein KIPB_003293 [Kipferlia bialata]|uniref:t-SNARE coiled-coil homology domain-containing protein n=1 Tax=Kipferlia bialata TaxID=797122 RepID=A0A9K3GH38_9EUKA|nr:hypothetical protein KIPB_003293 [Kipferlia bialata]|eukprot:g3293.t1
MTDRLQELHEASESSFGSPGSFSYTKHVSGSGTHPCMALPIDSMVEESETSSEGTAAIDGVTYLHDEAEALLIKAKTGLVAIYESQGVMEECIGVADSHAAYAKHAEHVGGVRSALRECMTVLQTLRDNINATVEDGEIVNGKPVKGEREIRTSGSLINIAMHAGNKMVIATKVKKHRAHRAGEQGEAEAEAEGQEADTPAETEAGEDGEGEGGNGIPNFSSAALPPKPPLPSSSNLATPTPAPSPASPGNAQQAEPVEITPTQRMCVAAYRELLVRFNDTLAEFMVSQSAVRSRMRDTSQRLMDVVTASPGSCHDLVSTPNFTSALIDNGAHDTEAGEEQGDMEKGTFLAPVRRRMLTHGDLEFAVSTQRAGQVHHMCDSITELYHLACDANLLLDDQEDKLSYIVDKVEASRADLRQAALDVEGTWQHRRRARGCCVKWGICCTFCLIITILLMLVAAAVGRSFIGM